MKLEPKTVAVYANEIARAFGLDANGTAAPRNERQAAAHVAALHAQLRNVRPVAKASSIGEVLDALGACARTDAPARRARKQLAELDQLVAAGTYARTKRAERGRIFAVLLVLFDLVTLTGVDIDAIDANDPETTLKLVRRARR